MSTNRDYLTELEIRDRFSADPEKHLADMRYHIRIIRENPGLKKLKLNVPDFPTELVADLCAALKACTEIESVIVWDQKEPRVTSAIAEAVAPTASLQEFEAFRTPLVDFDINTLVRVFKNHPTLNCLSLQHTMIGESGMIKLAEELLPTLPNLAVAELNESDGGPAAAEFAMEEALIGNPSIQLAKPETIALDAQVIKNQQRASRLTEAANEKLRARQPFNAAILAEFATIRPAVMHNERLHHTFNFFQIYDALAEAIAMEPAVPDASALTPDWLVTPNEKGYAPLDFPAMWEKLPELAAQLEKAGTPLGKAQLMRCPDGSDEPYLFSGVKLGHFEVALNLLVENGERVAPSDILKPDGTLTVLGDALTEAQQIAALFEVENWLGCPAHEARSFLADLPEAAREQVDNLHQLTAALNRTQNRQIQR